MSARVAIAPDPVLDAARTVFERYGARRANVDDVARAAGLSRSTLYRRYPTKDALLEAVLVREYDAFLGELDRLAEGLDARQAVVTCFVRGVQLTQEIPLLARLAEAEPETFTVVGTHGMLALATTRVAATLRRCGATLPDDELTEVAELLLRIAASYLLDPSGTLDVTDPVAVRSYAERRLAPLLG